MHHFLSKQEDLNVYSTIVLSTDQRHTASAAANLYLVDGVHFATKQPEPKIVLRYSYCREWNSSGYGECFWWFSIFFLLCIFCCCKLMFLFVVIKLNLFLTSFFFKYDLCFANYGQISVHPRNSSYAEKFQKQS